MTLPGPSRTVIVEPIRAPAREPQPLRRPAPAPPRRPPKPGRVPAKRP